MNDYILVILILLIAWYYVCYTQIIPTANDSQTPYPAPRRHWKVASGYDNNTEAADLMARVNSTMIEFMRTLKKKYHIDETDDIIYDPSHKHATPEQFPNDTYNIISNMLLNYNPDEFYENDPRFSKDTSYTVNKGKSMHLCLRNRDDPTKLISDNDVLFVLLHESAHIANYNDHGHTQRFWEVFKFILREAVESGIYVPDDYRIHPITYCGLYVDYQPLFDDTIRDL